MLKNVLIKTLFIIGIIIIILVLAFAVIRIVPKIFSGVASVGSFIKSPFQSEEIKITSNKSEVSSLESIILNWDHKTSKTGFYSVKYDCSENLNLQITTNNGLQNILCNTHYNLGQSKTVELTPILAGNTFIDLPITISFNEEGNSLQKSETINITVKSDGQNNNENSLSTATVTTESIDEEEVAPTAQPTTTAPAPAPRSIAPRPVQTTFSNIPADLAVSNLILVNQNTIQFDVRNIGGRSTGNWFFSYSVPNNTINSSQIQPSLASGQGIRYTLRFQNNFTNGPIVIVADSTNLITELNVVNNVATLQVTGSGTTPTNPTNPNTRADLRVSSMSVGYLSGNTFVETNRINRNDEGALRFTVTNSGGRDTGTWRLEVRNLPNNYGTYRSDRQNSLRPGESKDFTMRFDGLIQGNYSIRLEVDSDNDVAEQNENNNERTVQIRID